MATRRPANAIAWPGTYRNKSVSAIVAAPAQLLARMGSLIGHIVGWTVDEQDHRAHIVMPALSAGVLHQFIGGSLGIAPRQGGCDRLVTNLGGQPVRTNQETFL